MRQSWRLLLRRSHLLSHRLQNTSQISVQTTTDLNSLRHFTSFVRRSQVANFSNPYSFLARDFTSEAAVELKDSDHVVFVTDVFSKFEDENEIRRELELNNVTISHDLILGVLKGLDGSPDIARKFFDWVSKSNSERLSSKSYNSMLRVFGLNGFVNEFWGLIQTMKGKGYGVSKGVKDRMLEKFEKEGRAADVERLREVFASGSIDNSVEKLAIRVSRIVRNEVWSEEVERKLGELNVKFSGELVKLTLENLATEPEKALIFFRWVEESGLVKHEVLTYNAMVRVLGREDCIDRFWKLLDEMRAAGHEMESETYFTVLRRFLNRKMIEEAVQLYEFAMGGSNKPSVHDCTFLLRKVASMKDFDLSLFSRVVKAFTEKGNALTDSMVNAVLKSLSSVGRLEEYNNVLKVMEESGFVAGCNVRSKMAFHLSSRGQKDGVSEFMNNVEASGSNPGYRTWMSLIEGHCVGRDLEKASYYVQEMAKNEEGSFVSNALETVVRAYCHRNRAVDGCKLLQHCVSKNQVKPWHTTYKLLISNLLVQGGFKEALGLLSLMKEHGYPPFLDPFIEYISKSGTGDDAAAFSKAMTSKRYPSTSVYIRLFEAFFYARRRNEAQDFLAKCPQHISNHADILSLFRPKSKGIVAAVSS